MDAAHAGIAAQRRYAHRIQSEERMRLLREEERRNTVAAFVSDWQSNAAYVAWKNDLKRIKDMTAEEVALANHEFLCLRRKELRELFASDLERYGQELHAKGLAFHRNHI
ncbi:hypothetical protein HK105_200292 [Polyrhizophydium stewartii]|uniref:Uncharacterized protein n=1 Tax=Polyrhizophydium stewartii TaxID=2732419 RepID=A0ABR4NLB0_9FUNG